MTFRVARKDFAIEACRVRGILPVQELAPLPGIRPAVLGFASLSGRLIAVWDLRVILDLPQAGGGIDPRIIVVSVGGVVSVGEVVSVREHLAGFVADRVSGVHTYHARELRRGWLRGSGRPRRLLKVEKILGEGDPPEFNPPGPPGARIKRPFATGTAPAALPR